MIREEGVRPYLRMRVESSGSMDAPEGFVSDPAWTDAERMAEVTAAWVNAYQAVEPFSAGTPLEYSFFPQNLGHERWSSAPYFHHPLDRLGEEEIGLGNPFSVNGRAAVRAYSEGLMAAMDARLAVESLPTPSRLHLDMESAPSSSQAIAVEEGIPVGWWSLAQEDPRWDDEVVVDGQSLAEVYASASLVNGNQPSVDWSAGTWSEANGPMLGWFSSLNRRLKDFVLRESFVDAARVYWSDVPASNYDVVCATPEHSSVRNKVFMRAIDVPAVGLDYQSPVLYPASSSAYGEVGTQLADHLALFGLASDEPHTPELLSELYRARSRQAIDAAIAACPETPLAPWIGYPGWRRPIPGSRLGPGQPDSCYEVTAEDLIAIMTYGVEQGVREWLLWESVVDGPMCRGRCRDGTRADRSRVLG